MEISKQSDGTWLASGLGYDRPILAEGDSQSEAEKAYNEVFGDQYAEAQCTTYHAMIEEGTL